MIYRYVLFAVLLFTSCNSLSKSISDRDYKQIDLLLDQGANIDGFDFIAGYPLINAIKLEDLDLINKLLDRGADVNLLTSSGSTPLFEAIKSGDTSIVITLLDRGADINLKSSKGYTPLFYSVIMWDKNMIKLLLDRKADPNILSINRVSPFDLVIGKVMFKPNNINDIMEVMEMFIDHGYDINNDDASSTALTQAATCRDPGIVKFLLEKGADPNLQDRNGRTPMEEAMIIYTDFNLNRNVYLTTPEGRKETCDRMLEIMDLLRQYGAKEIE